MLHNVKAFIEVDISEGGEYADRNELLKFNNNSAGFKDAHRRGAQRGADVGKNNGIWGTYGTEPLTESMVQDILRGKAHVYLMYLVVWGDPRNQDSSTYGCRWLQQPGSANLDGMALIWHGCAEDLK
jgi:hypothetical protein